MRVDVLLGWRSMLRGYKGNGSGRWKLAAAVILPTAAFVLAFLVYG
jgi:hypothetical protein